MRCVVELMSKDSVFLTLSGTAIFMQQGRGRCRRTGSVASEAGSGGSTRDEPEAEQGRHPAAPHGAI